MSGITLYDVPIKFVDYLSDWRTAIKYVINGKEFYKLPKSITMTCDSSGTNRCLLELESDLYQDEVIRENIKSKVDYKFKTDVNTQFGSFPLEIEVLKWG